MSNNADDERWMARCEELADAARRAGHTAVGSIIVLDDRAIAEAHEEVPGEADPFGHAEIIAVRRSLSARRGESLSRTTLYTTAEPCWLCSFAIRSAGIGRVVFARATPEIGGVTSEHPLLLTTVSNWGPPPEITCLDT